MRKNDLFLAAGVAIVAYFLFFRKGQGGGGDVSAGGGILPPIPDLGGFLLPNPILQATKGVADSIVGVAAGAAQGVVSDFSDYSRAAGILAGYAATPSIAAIAASPQNLSTTVSQALKGNYAIASAPGGGLIYGNVNSSNVNAVNTGIMPKVVAAQPKLDYSKAVSMPGKVAPIFSSTFFRR